jgi:hypothetical protein
VQYEFIDYDIIFLLFSDAGWHLMLFAPLGWHYHYGHEAPSTMIKWVSVLRPPSFALDDWTGTTEKYIMTTLVVCWSGDYDMSTFCAGSWNWRLCQFIRLLIQQTLKSHWDYFYVCLFIFLLLVVITVIPCLLYSCCKWSLSQWLQTYVDICMYTPSTVKSTCITITC